MSSDIATREYRPASPAQLNYARALGLQVEGQPGWQVKRAINHEVWRRGREVLRTLQPKAGDLFEHPRNGVCGVVRINTTTLRVTLEVIADGRKFSVPAKCLGDYRRVFTDAQLVEFLNSLSDLTAWCRRHGIRIHTHGRQEWSASDREKARQIAGTAFYPSREEPS